jgi:hypothetical protein
MVNSDEVRKLTRQNRFTARMMDQGMDFDVAEATGKQIMDRHDTQLEQTARDRARDVMIRAALSTYVKPVRQSKQSSVELLTGAMLDALDAANLAIVDPKEREALQRNCDRQLTQYMELRMECDRALAAFRAFVRAVKGLTRRDDGGLWLPVEHGQVMSDALAAVEPYMGSE